MAFALQLRCFFHQEVHFIFLTIHLVVFAQLGLERKGNILPFSFSSLECAPEWTAPQSMGVKEYVLVGKGIKQVEKETEKDKARREGEMGEREPFQP